MKPSWTKLADTKPVMAKGTKVRATLIRWGHPVVETTLAYDTPFNYPGLMRVDYEGRPTLALYPPLEILE